MAYDPLNYGLARARIIGNTVGTIGSSIVDAANSIDKIVKQKNANEKVNEVYAKSLSSFADELMKVNPNIDKSTATITAMKIYKKPVDELGPEANLKQLVASDVPAQSYLDKMKDQYKEQQKQEGLQKTAEAAQQVATGRYYNRPETIQTQVPTTMGGTPEQGTITEQTVTKEEAPATTRQQAYGRYGQMMAEGQAPLRTQKELEQSPAIAALPEEEKGMTAYQEEMLKLRRDANDIARRRAAKGASEDYNKNLRWSQDRQDDLKADELKYSEKVSKLRSARIKLKAGKTLSPDLESLLAEEGIDPVNPEITKLDESISNYNDLIDQVKLNIDGADALVEELTKSKNLSKAITAGRKKLTQRRTDVQQQEQQDLENARTIMQTKYKDLLLHGSMDDIIKALPENLQSSVQKKVQEAYGEGYDDIDIRRYFGQGMM